MTNSETKEYENNVTVMPTGTSTLTQNEKALLEAEEKCRVNVLSKPYPTDGEYFVYCIR